MSLQSRWFFSAAVGSIVFGTYFWSCGKKSTKDDPATTSSGGSSGSTGTSCTPALNTTATTTTNTYGCPLLTRDVSSCKDSRTAQGLSGFWLKFSCNVTLTKSGSNVILSSKNLPDYKSYYYSSTDNCYEAFSSTARKANPNYISTQTLQLTVPYAPTAASSTTTTSEGVIGMALNGVAIFDNTAAPGDDIYNEEATFDKCDGHPEQASRYHYHTEPSSISNDDANFIGVMRDGIPIYGRKDTATGTTVTGLTNGAKTGVTVDSTTTGVLHYHANYQSNGTKTAYFLSAGAYVGTPGACTGCQ